MNRPPSGRVAIVTGASRGIGRAVAVRLASGGAAVVVAARTENSDGRLAGSIHEVVEEIRAGGGRALAVACDVSDPDAARALVDRARTELGPFDILVNNAALTVPERRAPSARPEPLELRESQPDGRRTVRETLSILNVPLAAYRRAFDVNLFGVYALLQPVLRGMVELGRGNVVNISSDAAHTPTDGPYAQTPGIPLHAYAASKAALEQLTRTVAYEMAGRGIAVNAVLPSLPVATPGAMFASGGDLGPTLEMDRFVDAVELLCSVAPDVRTGSVSYSEDLLDPAGRRRGWLGSAYL
jgi:7-alpha-hydroxysteroid dehydrogenase